MQRTREERLAPLLRCTCTETAVAEQHCGIPGGHPGWNPKRVVMPNANQKESETYDMAPQTIFTSYMGLHIETDLTQVQEH